MKNGIIIGIILWAIIIFGISECNADVSIATINYSSHFDECIGCEYNEKHGGVFLGFNGFAIGTYNNSYNNRSTAIGYESHFGRWKKINFSGSIILANGYEENDNSQGDLLLIPAFNVDWPIYKRLSWRTSYAVVATYTGLKYSF